MCPLLTVGPSPANWQVALRNGRRHRRRHRGRSLRRWDLSYPFAHRVPAHGNSRQAGIRFALANSNANQTVMPYIHTWESRGVVCRFSGHVTATEVSESADRIQGDRRFDALRCVLNDFRDCTSVDMPRTMIEEIAAKDGAAALTNSEIRIAVVSDHPDVLRIFDHYMAEALSPWVAKNFGSIAAARAWLAGPRAPIRDTQQAWRHRGAMTSRTGLRALHSTIDTSAKASMHR